MGNHDDSASVGVERPLSPQPHGSGLFHFLMRDIVSGIWTGEGINMIAKTREGKELHIPVEGNLRGYRLDSVELSFADLQSLMKQPDYVVLEFLRTLYGRMV